MPELQLASEAPLFRILPFITARELALQEPALPDAVVPSFLVRGSITEMAAKIKAGKSTFTLAMVRALLHEEPFLGRQTKRTAVCLLSEERPSTLRAALERASLTEEDDLHILHLHHTSYVSWEDIIRSVNQQILVPKQAGVLIVDTLSRWAKLRGDSENDSGAAAEAIEPLEQVAGAGIAVLVNRHDKRGEAGELGDWGRGSSGFGGAADIMLNLQRANQNGHPNRRIIRAISRYDDIPEETIVELASGVYSLIEEGERETGKALLLTCLNMGGAQDLSTLETMTGIARTTAQRALDEMVVAGLITKAGGGRGRGNSALYAVVTVNAQI